MAKHLQKTTCLVFLAIFFSGCGVLIGNPKSPDEDDDENDYGEDVQIAGDFSLTTPNANLVSTDLKLTCQTSEETPGQCSGSLVDGDSFSFDCPDFADKGLSCYLQAGEVTLATVAIEQGSGINVSGGVLALQLEYDPLLGFAKGLLDGENTSARINTDLALDADLTFDGVWDLSCSSLESLGLECKGDHTDQYSVGLYEFAVESGQKFVEMWWGPDKRTQCLENGGSAAVPAFFIEWAESKTPVSVDTKDGFVSSMDAVYLKLPVSMQARLRKLAADRVSDDIKICSNNESIPSWFDSNGCTKVAAYDDLYLVQVDELRRILGRLHRFPAENLNQYCSSDLSDTFTFDACDSESKPFLCHVIPDIGLSFGMEIKAGALQKIADYEQDLFLEDSLAQHVCPNLFSERNAGTSTLTDKQAFLQCQDEFLTTNTTPVAQANALLPVVDLWIPAPAVLTCDQSIEDSDKALFKASIESSCAPAVDYQRYCADEVSCQVDIRCNGASIGSCLDESGVYRGDLLGREAVFTYDVTSSSSIALNSLSKNSWFRWDPVQKKVVTCTYVERSAINGVVTSETLVDTIFSQGHDIYCDGDESQPFAGGDHRFVRFEAQ